MRGYDSAFKIYDVGECLNGGSLEEFFAKEEVIREGISLEGFVDFVGEMKRSINKGANVGVSWA